MCCCILVVCKCKSFDSKKESKTLYQLRLFKKIIFKVATQPSCYLSVCFKSALDKTVLPLIFERTISRLTSESIISELEHQFLKFYEIHASVRFKNQSINTKYTRERKNK